MIIIETSGEQVEFGQVDMAHAFYYEGQHWMKAIIPRGIDLLSRNDKSGAVNLESGCWTNIDSKAFVEVVDAIVTIGKAK